MQTPSLKWSNQIIGSSQISKWLNEKAILGEKLSQMLTPVSACFQAHLWFWGKREEETVKSGAVQAWDTQLRKCMLLLLSWLLRVLAQLLRRWVFPPDVQVVILPLFSLVQSDIQGTDMLPAATWDRHTRQIDFPETKSSCTRTCWYHPLVLWFSTTWQHSVKWAKLLVFGERLKQRIKQDTDDRGTLLLPKQVNAGASLACQALMRSLHCKLKKQNKKTLEMITN